MSNRSTWDGIAEGLHGDKTTTGAQGLSSLPNFSNATLGALRNGDKTTVCPKCGKTGVIVGNIPTMNLEGKIAAGNNADVICGCPLGTNRLICPAGQWMGDIPQPIPSWRQATPEQHAQAAKKPQPEEREPVDAGFCVMPFGATTETFQNYLFSGEPPAGTKELFRSLNGSGQEFKAGTIMLVVDPDKQDNEQISHLKAAKDRVDAALAPLTHQEANFLHKHYATIANFTSFADSGIGLASDPVGKYFESIEKILKEIQETYKNTYITRGALIGEQFYVRRSQLFKELDTILKVSFLNKAMKFGEYTKIKNALGLSTSAITHEWNRTGVNDIEGYATHIERAAKYVEKLKYIGYAGIGFSALHSINEVYQACSVGREDECTKKKYTEAGSFSGGVAGGLVGGAVGMGICSVVLGAISIEVGGVGALACGVILGGAGGYLGGEVLSSGGEAGGELIYETYGR